MEDTLAIVHLRKQIWLQTYRGIYPDEMLDQYPYLLYLERDKRHIASADQHWYLFLDGPQQIGYFAFGPSHYGGYKDFELCLNHLYLLDGYKRQGLGTIAISVITEYCHQHGIRKFFCGCNANNLPAIAFYRHMGGIQGDEAPPDVPKEDQIIHFEFYLGESV